MIAKERRKWVLGQLPKGYGHEDLMEIGLKTYNNQQALSKWDASVKNKLVAGKKKEGDAKFISLLNKLEETLKAKRTDGGEKQPGDSKGDNQKKGSW
eukprot:6594667-Ditylum_brightwellii.AAC.1